MLKHEGDINNRDRHNNDDKQDIDHNDDTQSEQEEEHGVHDTHNNEETRDDDTTLHQRSHGIFILYLFPEEVAASPYFRVHAVTPFIISILFVCTLPKRKRVYFNKHPSS